jgi:hypothetical protein
VWWLTPIIPATQEAEIRRITVRNQPGQKVSEIPFQSISQACFLEEMLKVLQFKMKGHLLATQTHILQYCNGSVSLLTLA